MITKLAFKVWVWCLRSDKAYRQTWHDNLAMMAYSAGASHLDANKEAGYFMKRLIFIDTWKEKNGL